MRGLQYISYRSVMTVAALAIMFVAFVTVTGVAWHGRGAGTKGSTLGLMSVNGTKRTSRSVTVHQRVWFEINAPIAI
jgi:hypothetical protein